MLPSLAWGHSQVWRLSKSKPPLLQESVPREPSLGMSGRFVEGATGASGNGITEGRRAGTDIAT